MKVWTEVGEIDIENFNYFLPMTSVQLTEIIATKSYPKTVTQFYRDWLTQLYNQGKVQIATRMLQHILENPGAKKGKTLL